MDDRQSFLDLQIDDDAGVQLTETSRWAKLLAILILSFTGILILLFLTIWSRMPDLGGNSYDPIDSRNMNMLRIIGGIALLFVGVIVAILMTFLLKAAKAIRAGVMHKDAALVNIGLGHLRSYFTMMGVLSVLMLLVNLFGFLVR